MVNVPCVYYESFIEILWLRFASKWSWRVRVVCATLISNVFILYTQPDFRISSEVSKLFCSNFQDSVEFLVDEK